MIDLLPRRRTLGDFRDQLQCATQGAFEHQIGIRASLEPIG